MFKLGALMFIVIVIVTIHNNKIRIKWKTFIKKGFAPNRGKFGVYCYCGKQGQG